MLKRMVIHSTVFTVLIALSAVALNGAGMLDSGAGFKSSHHSSWRHDDD